MSDHTRLIRNIGTVGDFDQIVLGGNGQAVAFEGTFEAQNEPAVAGYALAQGSGPVNRSEWKRVPRRPTPMA
ncbi:MAG: hypothetical protein R3E84_21350 [Pseudomonadales bacterium]